MNRKENSRSQDRVLLISLTLVFGVFAAIAMSDAASSGDSNSIHAVSASQSSFPDGQQVAQLFGGSKTAPTPKPTPEAVQDLKQNPPLNPLKAGDAMPMNLFVELGKLINPAVVSISTSQVQRQMSQRRGGPRDPFRDFFEEFWGMPPGGEGGPRGGPGQAMGSGFIIRADGLIITNNHVIEGADVIKVQLDTTSNQFYEAEVVGQDSRTDIALIKIDAKRQLPVAPLGDSDKVQVGEWVAAFGNPYGHAHTMTKGIISAVGREINELNRFPFLQTDASINPGNSGGPLVNSLGYVIGVNTAIDARAQGIGFAIPINNVKTIIGQLEKNGRVRRGYIGVGISGVSPEIARQLGLKSADGVLVNQIMDDGPAAKAGVELYDIIVEFNGKKTATPAELQNAVGDAAIGSKATMKVIRFDENRQLEKTLTIAVSENPDDRDSGRERGNKRYFGQKAPYNLGFNVSDMTPQLKQQLGIQGRIEVPVITDVQRGTAASAAGLQPGDLILDVNRSQVRKAVDVIKQLKNGVNILRISRGGIVAVIALEPTKDR